MSSKTPPTEAEKTLVDEFHHLVNMTAAALEKWLTSDDSHAVGQHKGEDPESTGHESGRAIVKILREPKRHDYSEAEISQMKRTVSYIKRHLAQKPHGKDIEHSRWASSLKNWGHDPT